MPKRNADGTYEVILEGLPMCSICGRKMTVDDDIAVGLHEPWKDKVLCLQCVKELMEEQGN